MLPERRIPTRSAQWRELYEQVQFAMDLTSQLNALRFSESESRHALLRELFQDPHAEQAYVHPPFYCTSGIGTRLGNGASVGRPARFSISAGSRSVSGR